MVTWRIDEYTLTTFHLRHGFHRDVLNCMTPWIRLATDLRRAIYLNATDRTRKDQFEWMKRYEKMLMEKRGESARFLPQDEEKPHARAKRERAAQADADPREAIVDFSEQ